MNLSTPISTMEVVRHISAWSALTGAWRRADQRIALVPTMGALHEGHLSLVRAARREADRVAVSIFVNPLQFGPKEDLETYPRTLADDLELLSTLGVDAVLVPEVSEMYPPGFSTFVQPPETATLWEGTIRPGHFRGVTTVVLKLLMMTRADLAFFGQKDFQQAVVVKEMIRDLNIPCALRVLPTVREPDGLAMSSRNRYLNDKERHIAAAIYRVLNEARRAIAAGQRDGYALSCEMNQALIDAGFDAVDYAVVCDPQKLTAVDTIQLPVVLLIAVRLGKTRLIDNWLIEEI